jgi:hypothetical protein
MDYRTEELTLENAARPPLEWRPLRLEDGILKNVVLTLCACLWLAPSGFAAPPSTPSSGRILYKWVDENGVTHYGDRIPPEYASQEQHVINSRGVEIRHVDAQKSSDQLAADEQKRADAAQRALRDKNLLSTFATVQEIERLRDQRLTLLADQIKVTSLFLENLDGRMKKLRADSARFRPYSADPKAPPMPDQLAEDLVRLSTDVHTQEQNLKEKRGEEAAMSIQFESDIDRFKELKHIQ